MRYCSAIWHFCRNRNRNKLEHLNKRALRIVLDQKSLHYQELLSKFNSSDMICIVLGAKTWWKQFLRQYSLKRCRSTFVVLFKWGRNTERNLRGSRKLVIPYVNTTTYGLHSFRYTSANIWNKLTEDESRNKIYQISFEHKWNCMLFM